jgi:hypothetical protein
MKDTVAWLNSEQAARYIGLVDADGNVKLGAFHVWVHRGRKRGLKVHRLGGRLRFRAVDLDRVVEAEPAPVPASKALRLVGGAR